MAAVRHNLMDMVKVLIFATDDRTVWSAKETTQVDLTLQDIDGKSVIHYCVKNREVRGAIIGSYPGLEGFSLLILSYIQPSFLS